MNDIVLVPFHGDSIEATQNERGVWAPLKRMCENLGIDPDSQRKRLADPDRSPWATTVVMTVVAADGKDRELFSLHLDSVPMWLATIETSRVGENVREKLVLYQKEAAKVLADHFYGRRQPAPIPSAPDLTKQITAGVIAGLSHLFVNSRPIDHLVTIEDRCKQRWAEASKKHQRRVRDVAIAIYRERLGRHPLKLTGHLNGTFAIEREHLDILDTAIDIIMEQVTGKQVVPLFDRGNKP